MSIFLGIDIGTQSVKALCYDVKQRQLAAVSSSPLELISDSDGTREQLAEWWLVAIKNCLSQIDPAIKQAVVAIGVSGQQHGFVPLAADGSVLTPVKLWCDTATVAECEQITAQFGDDQRCIRELGNPILPGYTASKIRWMKNHRPDEYRRLDTILLPHDYINFYLTGERAMEHGDASGTGLLDVRSRNWHAGMLAAVDADRDLAPCLPPLIESNASIGVVRADIAAKLGLPAHIPVSSGGDDNMMAAIGTGNVVHGRLTVSLGTSGTLFAFSDSPVVDERAAAVPPGANGVMTLPFFNGERWPNLPHGKGCILGLDDANYSPDNLLRSAMESAVYGLRAGLDAFREQGCDIQSVRLTGGGSRSASWRQLVADVFDLPVTVQRIDEGAALGAALQAFWMHSEQQGSGASIVEIIDEQLAIDPARTCQSNAEAVTAYREHYQHYLHHVDAISPLYGALNSRG